MSFDKFTPINQNVVDIRAAAEAGDLPATNLAVLGLCDALSALLVQLALATENRLQGVRALKVDNT